MGIAGFLMRANSCRTPFFDIKFISTAYVVIGGFDNSAKIKSSNKNYAENLLKLEDGEYKKYKGSLNNRQNNIKTLSGLDIGAFNLKNGKK